jgi:23S rRNA (guanosine2251-2'-O)-methyltransferase
MKKKQPRIYIYGKNVVREALMRAPHLIKTVYLSKQMNDGKLLALVQKSKIKTERIDPRRISSQVEGNAAHQGIVAHITLLGLVVPFEEFIRSFSKDTVQSLVYLDGVQDPHNVGTIIRSVAAFGAAAVLMPERGGSPVTPGVIKASAGALFSIPLVSVANPQQALSELRRLGVTVYGMAGEGAANLAEEKLEGSSLFVMGNEGEGLSPATRPLCHKMLRIPISRSVESLNVASAATAALFAWSTKHPSAL